MPDEIRVQLMADLYALEDQAIEARELSSKSRKNLPASAFVYPDERRYPIHDRAHAANALARSKGKPEEGKVRAAVCRRYPDLPACKRGN